MTTTRETSRPGRGTVPVREVLIFVLTAYALAWAVHAPLLINGWGPTHSSYGIAASVYMFTPAVAAIAVTLLVWRPTSLPRALGLAPLRPARRVGGYSLLAFVLLPLLATLATLVAGLLGAIRLDLVNFSGLRAVLPGFVPGLAETMPDTGFPWVAFLAALGLVVATSVPAFVLAFGEELGWRGYLLPRLLPLGVWPALLVSGAVWGLWHSPQLFIQYAHGGFDALQVVMFLAYCVVAGIIIGWLRLASGSVWPAVIAHGANNALLMVGFLTLTAADTEVNPLLYSGGTGGVIGLGVLVAVVLALALTGRIRVRSFDTAEARARLDRPREPDESQALGGLGEMDENRA